MKGQSRNVVYNIPVNNNDREKRTCLTRIKLHILTDFPKGIAKKNKVRGTNSEANLRWL